MTMRKSQTNSFQQGFTLAEVMVVVAIISILAAIGVPNILSWLPDVRLNGAARDLYGTFMQAKGEAAKRNRNCTLIFNQAIGGTMNAYVLFEDSNPANGAYDAGETIIFRMEQWPRDVFLNPAEAGGDGLSFASRGPGCGGNPAITFRSNGIPVSDDGCGVANGTAFLTNTNGRFRNVVVSNTGNIRVD